MTKRTPFYAYHLNLQAQMVDYAGYKMPILYSGIKHEHNIVRNNVGVFDVSHMGQFVLKGAGALNLIQRITSNDAASLKPGQAQYSCLPNETGGIIDDLIVYHLEDGNYMLVVNAANIEKDWQWLIKHNKANVEAHNISEKTALLAVQGPNAAKTLQSLTDIDLSAIPFYHAKKGVFAGEEKVLISATGYTGSGGFELYFRNEQGQTIWEAVMDAGIEWDIKPCGLGARDTLRLEMGYCLYDNDIDETTSPIEAGLSWITKTQKQVDFPSKDIFEQQKKKGVERKLVGFEMIDKGIARQGYSVLDKQGNSIGKVTSGTMSPSVKKSIGMAYVPSKMAKPGTEITINIRHKQVKAKVV